MALSTKLPFDLMLTQWSSQLNPFLARPTNQISVLQNVKLAVGSNTINHLLGQMQQGWIITDIQAPATIYRSAPFNAQTLVLTSSAITTVNIGVF